MTQPTASDSTAEKRKRSRWLIRSFAIVLIVLVVDLLIRIFCKSPLGKGYQPLFDFWVVWEVASIAVTAGVTFVYWRMYFAGGHAYARVMSPATIVQGSHAVSFGSLLLIVAAIAALFETNLSVQMIFLVFGVSGPVYLEHSVLSAIPASLTSAKSKTGTDRLDAIRDVMSVRDDMLKFMMFSDLPILIAFICILFYVVLNAVFPTGVRTEDLRPFVGGAVAIQLLYSNVVFLVENWTPPPGWHAKVPWLAYLDEMTQPELEAPQEVPNVAPASDAPACPDGSGSPERANRTLQSQKET